MTPQEIAAQRRQQILDLLKGGPLIESAIRRGLIEARPTAPRPSRHSVNRSLARLIKEGLVEEVEGSYETPRPLWQPRKGIPSKVRKPCAAYRLVSNEAPDTEGADAGVS